MEQCPACGGGPVRRDTCPSTFEYKGQTLTYDQPAWWCAQCGEALLEPSDQRATDTLLHDHQAQVDGRLTTEYIRQIRKTLGLTQQQAGQIIGGGHNAFNRYEQGIARPPKATENFLRLLDRHPHLITELLPEEAA